MTEAQKKKRAEWEIRWKPAKGALGKSFFRAVVEPLQKVEEGDHVDLTTDRHPLYPLILRRCPKVASRLDKMLYVHNTVDSKLPRTFDNPLFPVNYMDRELRKDLANHVRETTRYSREANHMVERVSIFAVDHNLNKKFRIKERKDETTWHWEQAGLNKEMVEKGKGDKFYQRPWRQEGFMESLKRMWDRDIPGPDSKAKSYLAEFWKA